MRSLILPLSLSAFMAVLALPTAQAALITYTDEAAYHAAFANNGPFVTTTIDFEHQAPANGTKSFSSSTGYVISGAQFVGYATASTYALLIVDSGASSPYFDFGSGGTLKSPSYDRASNATFLPFIRVTLPANVGAVGVDLMTVSPNALTYQVAVQGSTFNIATAVRPNRTFFGVTSDIPISFLDFTVAGTSYNGGSYGLLDNFQFEQTPEPGTFLLIGGGLMALGTFRKRQRNLKRS
ncbi:MAG: PEP-CTERM sorting domain-containing protein [Acidobacteriota bacterium]|nr:PEP-CTERM sorting domain-containing protein [Acidobacteriota bacterium]